MSQYFWVSSKDKLREVREVSFPLWSKKPVSSIFFLTPSKKDTFKVVFLLEVVGFVLQIFYLIDQTLEKLKWDGRS